MVKKIFLTICLMSGCLLATAQQCLNLHTTTQGVVTFSFEETPVVTFSEEILKASTGSISVEFPFNDIEKITFEDRPTSIQSVGIKEGNGMVSIYDISGRLIRKYKSVEGKTSVDLSSLPSGIYVINDGKRTYKIIKK